ncbi:MAG: SPOR domain-containing protein [Pseudomonadota bacterium]|nr:SPOR domain-containing protein [Pseudomonadota bacterium]
MNQFGGSRTDTLVKLVLIFFIALLSFSVGTYVGKNVTESQYKLSSLESSLNDDSAQASNDETTELKEEEALTDEDIASLTDEFANAKKEDGKGMEPAEEMAKDGTREVASHGAAKVAATHAAVNDKSPVAVRVAAGKSPTETKVETPKAEALPKEIASTTTGKYTVQIASFAKEDEAVKRSEELKAQGYSAFYISAQVSGKTWYRVSVGLFQSPSSAAEFKTELMKKANIQSAIVQKIVQ